MKDKLLLREYNALCPDGVCDVTLLTEAERKLKDGGYKILTGIFQSANKKNGNGRVYGRGILEREFNNYQKIIRERRALGEIDHPDESVVNLKNASHMVLRTFWQGDDLWGTIKVLKNTPAGKILEGLIMDGVQLGISSRGLGSLEETNEGAMVQEDFQLICMDIVSEPSTENAFMKLQEAKKVSVSEDVFTKADRLNRILNDITRTQ